MKIIARAWAEIKLGVTDTITWEKPDYIQSTARGKVVRQATYEEYVACIENMSEQLGFGRGTYDIGTGPYYYEVEVD